MTAPRNGLAEVIWTASRADEGTISAIGAEWVADAILDSAWLAEQYAAQRAGAVREALSEVERRVAADFPLNGELRPDGTEDPEAAAYIEGLNVAWNIVQEILAEQGSEGR